MILDANKRFQYPAIIRTKRNFLLLFAGVALLLTPLFLWDSVPSGTSALVWLAILVASAGANVITGLIIWRIIGPAVSTGTRFVFFTEPTPPQDLPAEEPTEK